VIDHLSVGVPNIESAANFYDTVLGSLGYKQLFRNEGLLAYGNQRIEFLVMLPADSNTATAGNGVHIALTASAPGTVQAFHRIAVDNGATCAGEPGPRPVYGEGAYADYVRDPFGNKLEVVSGGFAG